MPHLAEGRPSGIYREHPGENLRRNLIATDPSGKSSAGKTVKNARCSDCVQQLDYIVSIVYPSKRFVPSRGSGLLGNARIFSQVRINNLIAVHI